MMNTLSIRDLCCLFCCPPLPSRIAAKLGMNFKEIDEEKTYAVVSLLLFIAFLPPEPTYSLIPTDESTTATNNNTSMKKNLDDSLRYRMCFSDKAEWQHSANDLLKLDAYYVTTLRHNRIACIYVNCTTNPKFYILFSHGNAVDLGKLNRITRK